MGIRMSTTENRTKEKRGRSRFQTVGVYFVLCLLAFTMTIPFIWMVLGSLKPNSEVEQPHFVPQDWQPENYAVVLGLSFAAEEISELDIDFTRWYYNSIFVTFAVTTFQLLTCAMAAYAFARIKWKGRDTLFLFFLATLMIPPLVLLIPNFQLMVSFDLVDTYAGLILPSVFFGAPFGIFLMRQFMLTIPSSLDEAAAIDGANHYQVFWEIILPLSRAGLVTLAIFAFMANFQSFFWPLVMLKREALFTLPIGLLSFDSSYGRQTELILAATVISIAPLIVLFLFAQKTIVEGIQLGALKG